MDIWSIGVICYILLCGYFPFTGDESFSEDSMFSRIMTATFSFPDPEWTHISQEAKVCRTDARTSSGACCRRTRVTVSQP